MLRSDKNHVKHDFEETQKKVEGDAIVVNGLGNHCFTMHKVVEADVQDANTPPDEDQVAEEYGFDAKQKVEGDTAADNDRESHYFMMRTVFEADVQDALAPLDKNHVKHDFEEMQKKVEIGRKTKRAACVCGKPSTPSSLLPTLRAWPSDGRRRSEL